MSEKLCQCEHASESIEDKAHFVNEDLKNKMLLGGLGLGVLVLMSVSVIQGSGNEEILKKFAALNYFVAITFIIVVLIWGIQCFMIALSVDALREPPNFTGRLVFNKDGEICHEKQNKLFTLFAKIDASCMIVMGVWSFCIAIYIGYCLWALI